MKIYLSHFSRLSLIFLILSVSNIQAEVIKQEELYNENGVIVTYQLLDVGTRSLGVPGDLRDYPFYRIRLILQNNTGKRIRFRNHSTVSFMQFSIGGTGFPSVGINGNYVYDPGETVMYSRGSGFVFDDERFEEIGSPRYSIAAWYIYGPADGGNEEERESQLTKILNQGQVEQLREERQVERQRLAELQRERERQEQELDRQRRAEAEQRERERQAGIGNKELFQPYEVDRSTIRTMELRGNTVQVSHDVPEAITGQYLPDTNDRVEFMFYPDGTGYRHERNRDRQPLIWGVLIENGKHVIQDYYHEYGQFDQNRNIQQVLPDGSRVTSGDMYRLVYQYTESGNYFTNGIFSQNGFFGIRGAPFIRQ